MANGDILIDREFDIKGPSWRVVLFACEDSTRPNGTKYRFQCYDTVSEETVLRYDNSYKHPTAGWHHRHRNEEEEPDPIAFHGLRNHIQRFRCEVSSIND